MKNKTKTKTLSILLSLVTLLLLMPGMTALADASPKVTMEFTSSDNVWDIPTSKTTGLNTYTYGTYSIKLYSSGAGSTYYKMNSDYLLLGKQNAYLELPAFDFDVEKIVITGNSAASASVEHNIFVGDNEVSTAVQGSQETQTFEIESGYQSAGNVYTIKVLSNHNVQISKIEIYEKVSTAPAASINIVNKDAYIDGGKGYVRYITELTFDDSMTVDSFGTWFIPSDLLATNNYATVQYDGSAITSGQTYTADLLGIPGTELDRSIVGISFVNFAGASEALTAVSTSTVNSIIAGGNE